MRNGTISFDRGRKTGGVRGDAARRLRWLALICGGVLISGCGEPSSSEGSQPKATVAGSGGSAGAAGGAPSEDAGSGGDGGGGGAATDDASAAGGDGGLSTGGAAAGGEAGSGPTDGGLEPDSASQSVYAHVVAVSVSGVAGGYTYAVSIESADIDCSQYADWWEVLDSDGQLVYRHILTHSHTDANGTTDPDAPGNTFTRSGGPIAVNEDDVVIVRAHMNNAGYYGMAMQGSAAEGFREAPEIAPGFAAEVEALDPQPQSCAF